MNDIPYMPEEIKEALKMIQQMTIDEAISKMITSSDKNICWNCDKEGNESNLSFCGKCKIARYCCAACQREDWKSVHKIVCVIHREDIDDVTHSNLSTSRNSDLFKKANKYFDQQDYLKAERLYKNLMIVLRNHVVDRNQILYDFDFDPANPNIDVLMNGVEDTYAYTGSMLKLASIYEHLNKLSDAVSMYVKCVDTHKQLRGGENDSILSIGAMKSLAKLYTQLNKHSELQYKHSEQKNFSSRSRSIK